MLTDMVMQKKKFSQLPIFPQEGRMEVAIKLWNNTIWELNHNFLNYEKEIGQL